MTSSDDDSATDSDKSSGDVPASNSNIFSEGERVLAYHGPKIYEAKVQKAEIRKKEWRYFVHYLGWNKNWDEWVDAGRLLKHNAENIHKQQNVDKKPGSDKNSKSGQPGGDKNPKSGQPGGDKNPKSGQPGGDKNPKSGQPGGDKNPKSGQPGGDKNPKSGRSAQIKPKNSADAKVDKVDKVDKADKAEKVDKEETKNTASKGKKRKADSGTEKVHISSEKAIKLQIPSTLKKQLVEDWEFVNQENKLVKLPRSPTVDDILKKYLDYRSKKDGMISDSTGEILNGIRCYFDKALPAILLYKMERQQYDEAISNNVSPSSIYGAEHLLRLFVKLPELLGYVKIEPDPLTRLQNKLLDILKYMQKHQGAFFHSSYESPKLSEGGSGSGKGKDS